MAMNFAKGDIVEWEIVDKDTLILKRKEVQGKKEFNQRIYYDFNLESMVPDNHLLKRN